MSNALCTELASKRKSSEDVLVYVWSFSIHCFILVPEEKTQIKLKFCWRANFWSLKVLSHTVFFSEKVDHYLRWPTRPRVVKPVPASKGPVCCAQFYMGKHAMIRFCLSIWSKAAKSYIYVVTGHSFC